MKNEREQMMRRVAVDAVRKWVLEHHTCAHPTDDGEGVRRCHPNSSEGTAGCEFLLALGEETYDLAEMNREDEP